MPITADKERQLLNHYHLTSLYPTEWPHQDDEFSEDDEGGEEVVDGQVNRTAANLPSVSSRSSVSKYRTIDRDASFRSNLSGTQKHDGVDSLVQKDEPDALGKAPSVAAELRRKGLPVEENVKLRNRFMLSSTSFSPALYLSQVHQDATTDELRRGLDFLSRSIEQKSASLKVLVESNFEKFVRAKATIDNVYNEMRAQGAELPDPSQSPVAGRKPHSRHTSRNSVSHFRNPSAAFTPASKALPNDKKKNALTKESDYGVLGIKTPLQDLSIRAEEVWGSAVGGREKEEALKAILGALEQHRDIFQVSGSLHDDMRKADYGGVVEQYRKAKKFKGEALNIADIAKANGVQLGDSDAQQIIVTARMWHQVSQQIEVFKRDVWKRLKTSHGAKPGAVADEADKDMHMELIGVLLQLGVDENPIWVWLNSRCMYLRNKLARSFERSRIEIEILRRRLAAHDAMNVKILAKHLRSATGSSTSLRISREAEADLDIPPIIEFWEKVHSSINSLLSSRNGVLGEVLEFWETTQSFIDNNAQKTFPTAVFAAGLEHLELEPDDVASLRAGAIELVDIIRESVLAFFTDAPVEDLSELYSPIPPTPITPESAGGSALTPGVKRGFTFDANNVPPPSPLRGDAWEKFAFWPPHANSLSGSHYLSKALNMLGTAANEMASLSVIKQARSGEQLKALVNAVRERCIQAVCAAWTTDAERCKFLESWVRSPERRDLTTMPASFMAFEENVLSNMQKIAYISEATAVRGNVEVVLPPPAKLLQAVRGSFVTSLYKALSGTVENAEKTKVDSTGKNDPDGVTIPRAGAVAGDTFESAVDATNSNIRKLMTLSNLAHLRSDIIPHLISQFESSFSVKLTEESKTISDVLGQIDARLFQSYVKPTVTQIDTTITTGITSPSWLPITDRPTDARSYVYDVLLILVLAHSDISTTASALTNQILSYFLEQASQSLMSAFKTRPRYSLPALMQATLDVEFMAQTLNNYTTEKAGEVQSQIYLALDERTDDDARKRLQGELPEMRATLKRLRENTKGEFVCFKRDRKSRDRGGTTSTPRV